MAIKFEAIAATEAGTQIVIASTSALTVVTGVVIARIFTKGRENLARASEDQRAHKTRRLELILQQIDKQVSEFYGPIHNILLHLRTLAEIKHTRMEKVHEAGTFEKISSHLERKHFMDLHNRIIQILREKAHLVGTENILESFNGYMRHFISKNIQIEL